MKSDCCSETFFSAKRRIVAAIDFRLENIRKKKAPGHENYSVAESFAAEKELERIRDFVRNGCLYERSPNAAKPDSAD